ncbi:hypothetical protein Y032_0012g1830 [Ancylostoma ceylanicum]|uniref:Uncharacterized protein n=1 Tax=Ancylostoma ceylanicum TaxID=53326 RepID=A0A016VCE3_9BILA|nr:hypothetical protein Y032_0012g1830 [Ancylostoma ceylanicum]
MVRKLKLHEKKLLKKTDFMQWEVDQQGKQSEQMRKYTVFVRKIDGLRVRFLSVAAAGSRRDLLDSLYWSMVSPHPSFRFRRDVQSRNPSL